MTGKDASTNDHVATVAAVGSLAYLFADVVHHLVGHAGACVVSGGKLNLLSSIFVDCSIRGTGIDLAGPFANLVFGLFMLFLSKRSTEPKLKLFLILASAFNLFWFEMQLAFSAATKTDDWAWAIQKAGLRDISRYAIVGVALVAYRLTIDLLSSQIKPYASSESRIRRIIGICWLAAGASAFATALLDRNPAWAILYRAIPQSMLLSIGLLFIPKRLALNSHEHACPLISRSTLWIAVTIAMNLLSIALLGPGI